MILFKAWTLLDYYIDKYLVKVVLSQKNFLIVKREVF